MHATLHDEMLSAVGLIAIAIEVVAVAIIGIAVLYGTILFIARRSSEAGYEQYKHTLGKGLLLGLEILVAADIIRTVALEPTIQNIFGLGLLVLVRTFLSWSLVVEIDGRWPWQREAKLPLAESSAMLIGDESS